MALNAPTKRMWGRYEHSLDDKGRMVVPQRFREILGEEFVLTTGPGLHVRAYPLAVWEELEASLVSSNPLDELNPDLVVLQRMFGSCEFVRPDKESRLSISRHLREWAKLREGEICIIVGSGSRLELWSRQNWETCSTEFTAERTAAAANVLKGLSEDTGQAAALGIS